MSKKLLYPAIIDIEASGFGSHSYPIEIGAVTATGERYCALIAPMSDWQHWSTSAETVHGISREHLAHYGKPAHEICLALNALLGTTNAYCDAWTHDSAWLNRLFFAGRVRPSFRLSAIEMIASEAQLLRWDTAKIQLAQSLQIKRHRASGDAFLIQQTYLLTQQQLIDAEALINQSE
jgi:hypothetical protein